MQHVPVAECEHWRCY